VRKALIIGGANCLWDDIEAAREFGPFHAVIAVNDAGWDYPGHVDIWASLHPEHFLEWAKKREANGYSQAGMYVGHKGSTIEGRRNHMPLDYVTDYRWPPMSGSGSSGLFAVKVALEHGYDRNILCGVPMMRGNAHFFDGKPWDAVDSFTEAWKQAFRFYSESTRSMSGWTASLLGKPTPDWLGA
jgi:hypothetical protein